MAESKLPHLDSRYTHKVAMVQQLGRVFNTSLCSVHVLKSEKAAY